MFQAGATCYLTAAAANAAAGSAHSGSVVPVSGSPSVLTFRAATDTSITYDYAPIDGSPSSSQVVSVSPPACGLLTAADALDYGWMVGGVWVAVYCVTWLTRMMHAHFGPQNDT